MNLPEVFLTARNAFLQIGPGKVIKGFATLLVILAIGWWAKSVDFEAMAHWIDFSAGDDGAWYQGRTGYVLIGMAFTAIGGPRQVVAFFAAYLFGFWTGLALSMTAVVGSCILDMVFARIFEDKVRAQIRGRVDIAFEFWRDNPLFTTILIRLLPVGSNFLTNLAAGATGIPALAFVLGSAIGYVPQMAIFALMGTGVDIGAGWQVTLAIALFAILTVFGLWIYGTYRKKIRAARRRSNSA